MSKIWLVAANTYRQGLRAGSFLFLTFVIPVLLVVAGIAGYLLFGGRSGLEKAGYVDQTGRIPSLERVENGSRSLEFIRFEDQAQAQAALAMGKVQAYLLIPADYFAGVPVSIYAVEPPGPEVLGAFERSLRLTLLPSAPGETLDRIEDPAEITFIDRSSGIELNSEIALMARILAPMLLAVLFSFAVAFMTSQLGSAVLREKENRAMEIVITSLRPGELIAGKVLGMALLAITQFTIWVAGGFIAVLLLTAGGGVLPEIALPWKSLLWGLLLIPPGYLLYAILSSGAGIIAGDGQQAQQLAGLLGLFAFLPMWFTPVLVQEPDSGLAIFFTLFPLSAPTAALFRMSLSNVPNWQLIASFALLVLSLLLAIWAVARIFRAAMLIYGKTASPGLVWRALWQD